MQVTGTKLGELDAGRRPTSAGRWCASPKFCVLVIASAMLIGTGCSSAETTKSENSSSGASSTPAAGDETSEEGEALFAQSGSATSDKIFGVWTHPSTRDGRFTLDLRTRFSADSIEVASRCTLDGTNESIVADVTASARISNTEISVLEANSDVRAVKLSDGSFDCKARTSAGNIPACVEGEMKSNCFALSGTTLTIYGRTELDSTKLTKVSD